MLMRCLLSSPLLHFFLLGGLFFALFAAMNPTPETPQQRSDSIILTPDAAGQLAARFAMVWQRPPSPRELEGLILDWVTEEALVREAQTLGLDRGDAIVRNRLRQKMLFLAEAPVASLEPDEASLEVFFREKAERFVRPGRISFRQVMLPSETPREKINAMLGELRNGTDPDALERASLLPSAVDLTPLPAVDRIFGEGFGDRVRHLPEGHWVGPVESGFGQHLVRLTAFTQGGLPPLDAVREQVMAEWRAEQMRTAREAFVDALLARYEITLPDVADVPRP